MPPYRHADILYLQNLLKMMESYMHKELLLHHKEMYIVTAYSQAAAELQLHWRDYLTDVWCYSRFPFEYFGTTAFTLYVNKVIQFFNITLYHAAPLGDSPFADVLL